ncbi:potassium transporter Kup [Paracoccus aerius]|uniref:Probable potassium transport system protein Kup n=1 Tax=Paracoccus aerius TaxID=1915382 RepID=A0ABS1S8F1_9RHOB|nr:potassium transporter Kup [Paracoccus aerius]MBL3673942.1 potassium transporter Kup [Paracoccus aerius]GHG27586.1 putative potassium transport system protein kup [Paracoccus aerius]
MASEEAASSPRASDSATPQHHQPSRLTPALVLACLGVVYGDIGTSPLYALRESLVHAHEEGLPETSVIGIVSLLFWTVVLIVTIKYVILILRADNNGEGGTLSLVAKAQGALKVGPRARRRRLLLLLGIVGVSLFFGDSMITPAISVLSAVEGLTLVQPAFQPWVVPVTLGIVMALFWVQSGGTDRIARLFGPVMLAWFTTMAILGISHIADDARILQALNPLRAASFLTDYGIAAMPVLGSVFLAVTGAEALYADMGHFGRSAIRTAWSVLVFPALALSYLGQGAMVLAHPERVSNPFFLMAPDWFLVPLVILATAATVIASQAVISGAFSVAAQAVQMGLLPRLHIQHTSDQQAGQIYLPKVNFVLLLGVVALVISFGSSARLASAYGIAVTGDMVITSLLAVIVFRWSWNWGWPLIALVMVPVLGIELIFFSANLIKLLDGGYIPLLFAALAIAMMMIWVEGMRRLQDKLAQESISMDMLAAKLAKSPPTIVPGTAVFLTADPMIGPPALLHNLKHNRVLHERNFIVKVESATTPRVSDDTRLRLEQIATGFWRAWLSFGYMEQPNVPRALAEAKRQGQKFDIMSTSFFLNRRILRSGKGTLMPHWMSRVFVRLYRSAAEPTNYYRLPSNRVVELGQQKNI